MCSARDQGPARTQAVSTATQSEPQHPMHVHLTPVYIHSLPLSDTHAEGHACSQRGAHAQ